MTSAELTQVLVFVSGTLRIVCLVASAFAIHDVIRNGLHIRKVPLKARAVLYFALAGFSLSAMASCFRLAGESWAPLFREMTHTAVSTGIIGVSCLVLYARSCAGEIFNSHTGRRQPSTETGPLRLRDESDTDFQGVRPLRVRV